MTMTNAEALPCAWFMIDCSSGDPAQADSGKFAQ
jgi:hypothetical protein